MKQRLIEIIKKVLTEQPKKKKCDCGCNTCTVSPSLNESKQYEMPISENMRYHLDNKIQIHDNMFRPGSKSHIELIHEARLLWKKGIIELKETDKHLFENTDLGRFGIYEGEVVPLDLPLMEIENIPGGLAKNKSLEDIAKHHNIDVNTVKKQLEKGIKTELEHTSNKNIAKEIAMDHIYEDPKYYDKLKKMETKEVTGTGASSGSYSSPVFGDSAFTAKSNAEVPKKVEANEVTGASSSGQYSGPAIWAKSSSPKDWEPSRKPQYKGGEFVKVKGKCKRFPYCNQGDIKALKMWENKNVSEAIKSASKKLNLSETTIKAILQYEMENTKNKKG